MLLCILGRWICVVGWTMGYVWTMQGCVCTECYLYGDPKISYMYLWDSLDQGCVEGTPREIPRCPFYLWDSLDQGHMYTMCWGTPGEIPRCLMHLWDTLDQGCVCTKCWGTPRENSCGPLWTGDICVISVCVYVLKDIKGNPKMSFYLWDSLDQGYVCTMC